MTHREKVQKYCLNSFRTHPRLYPTRIGSLSPGLVGDLTNSRGRSKSVSHTRGISCHLPREFVRSSARLGERDPMRLFSRWFRFCDGIKIEQNLCWRHTEQLSHSTLHPPHCLRNSGATSLHFTRCCATREIQLPSREIMVLGRLQHSLGSIIFLYTQWIRCTKQSCWARFLNFCYLEFWV